MFNKIVTFIGNNALNILGIIVIYYLYDKNIDKIKKWFYLRKRKKTKEIYKMRTKTYVRKDGTEGENYFGEPGDKYVSRFEKVGKNENAIVKDGKAIIIKSFFLGVTTPEGKELTLSLTQGQTKNLEKVEDLSGKTLEFTSYENEYGKQIGVKVNK
jgi:hypothetical protein